MSGHFHLDLETYATFDIKNGAFPYAEHPETEILIAGVSEGDGEPEPWVNPKFEIPGVIETSAKARELLDRIHEADTITAHNAQFEEALMEHRGFLDMGVQAIPQEVWRCTAALGRKAGFRSKLAHLSEDLNLDHKKYETGKSLIPFFCTPTPQGRRRLLTDYPEKAKLFMEYCLQDVRAEQEIARRLKAFELKGQSLAVFQFTNRLNRRGIPVNVPALRNAQRTIEEVDADLGQKFFALTGLRQTQRDKVFHWLRSHGYTGENMQAETVEAVMNDIGQLDPVGVEAIELYSQLAYAAAKKVSAMLEAVCSDGTVKGTLLYHGAGTGRWSGRGIQPQNFKKPTIAGDLALAFEMVSQGAPREHLELMFGPALEVIASVIRNFIGPKGGCLDADYNAIEARIANWLAGQTNILDIFRRMDTSEKFDPRNDIYLIMAAGILEVDVSTLKKKGSERTMGKVFELGAQYNLGWRGAQTTAEGWGLVLSEELARKGITVYRKTHDKLPVLWKLLDTAAKNAVKNPRQWYHANQYLSFIHTEISGIPYLLMRLPSGRTVAYPRPEIKRVWKDNPDKPGDGWMSDELSYYGQLPGKAIMGRVKLYGGKLLENASQAIAADLMAHGALNAEAAGFDIFALIHDQALAANDPRGCEPFIGALVDLPEWAKGLPLKAEGDWVRYYLKE